MILLDVNVLVHAYREDAQHHREVSDWLSGYLDGPVAFGVSDLVLSGFLRIVTHPRIFDPPSPTDHALEFTEALRSHPNCIQVSPKQKHWKIFVDLCRKTNARGNLIPDAFLAALAIESGSEWISYDRDFARFGDLDWRAPTPG